MKLRINYNRDTDTLSLSWAHRESERCSAWCSSHNTGWEMTPEQWLDVIGEVRKALIKVQHDEMPEQQPDDLAAKIAEHGPAT